MIATGHGVTYPSEEFRIPVQVISGIVIYSVCRNNF